MKAKTLKAFIDRETGVGYNVGDIYESDASERLDELAAGGYIVAIALTTPVMCAMMAFMKMPIEWYMVFGSFLASFVVAKVSMSGWDDVNELFNRLFRVK